MARATPKQTKYLNRFFTGLYTQRSPLVTPFSFAGVVHIIEKEDALLDGLNVEQGNTLTYQRRPGHSAWLTAALGAAETVRNGYTWRRLDGTIYNILDTTAYIAYVAGGGTSKTNLITLNANEGVTWPIGVGDKLYIATGSRLSKWDTSTVTNWGIVGPSVTPAIAVDSGGSLSPTSGYQYVYCFRNSTTGHISNASPISGNTGAQTSKNFTITGGTTSDSQVDSVEIYRTTDGGGVFYKLADVTYSSSWTYTDSTADIDLVTTLQAPLDAQNTPPPAGLTQPVWYAGYVWGIVGNLVYYSGGAAITNGVPEECWPPLNYFTFPGPVQRLVPTSSGIQVWLPDTTYMIVGVDATSFAPMPWTEGLGIRSPFAIAVDGATIYAFTSKRQLLAITGTDSAEPGFPVGDLLGDLSPSSVVLAVHRANSQDCGLYISDGAGTRYRYNLTLQSWATKATPGGGCGWIGSLETAAGVWSLIVAPQSAGGTVVERVLGTYTDSGSAYDAWFTLGSLLLAPPGGLANLIHVSVTLQNTTSPAVSILTDEVSGTFTALTGAVAEPPEFPSAATVQASRYYLAGTDLSNLMRHTQLKVDFGSSNDAGQILELALATTTPPMNTPPGVF